MEEKDIVIIGGGPGGYVAAIHAAHLGADVAVIERDSMGGTCLNWGCIPTKALVRSVEVLSDIKRAGDFGINTGSFSIDFRKIMARKDAVVGQLVAGVERLMTSNNINVYRGAGRLLSPHSVLVNGEQVNAKKVIIATGSVASIPPVPGVDLPCVLTTDGILQLKELPQSLIIIGGSVVGIEFATIFNTLGVKVTVVEMLPRLLDTLDEEIGRRFAQLLSRQGVTVHTSATVKSIEKNGSMTRVIYDTPKGSASCDGCMVLLAAGRKPHTANLGLSELGIKMNGRGIAVDEHMETNIKDIYAIGDVLGQHMLAHVASYEGEIAAENALGAERKADYCAVPSCVFTMPEIAAVGLTEKEAREAGIAYKVSKIPFTTCGRAVAMGEVTGVVKLICHVDNGKILGMHIFGPQASSLIAEGTLAIRMGATAEDIAHTIHAHPTLSEAVMEAAMEQIHGAIHLQKMR